MLALTEITGVKGARARLLYQAGLRTPADVAQATKDQLLGVRGLARPGKRAACL
jgi:predicted flap endonuclease-1-like 5' DNA nuclease